MATQDIIDKIKTMPDIDYSDNAVATFIGTLIDYAKSVITTRCNLPRFPDGQKAYSRSKYTPSVNIVALGGNKSFLLSINGSPLQTITLATLAGLTSGALIAAALQTAITTVLTVGADYYFDFLKTTVTYNATTIGKEFYQILSPKFGPAARVIVDSLDSDPYIVEALGLGVEFGGRELPGCYYDVESEDHVAMAVANSYRQSRLAEEITDRNVDAATVTAFKMIDDALLGFIRNRRRMNFK